MPSDPVLWYLPDREGRPTILPESEDPLEWARVLESGESTLAISRSYDCSSRPFSWISSLLSGKVLNCLKRVGLIALAGVAWIGFGYIADRRMPEGIGLIFTFLGTVAIAYAAVRHGYAALRWNSFLSTVRDAERLRFSTSNSALLDAIDESIQYRASIEDEAEIGNSPDKELLDSKAYENLSKSKGIPMREIVRLAKTLHREIGGMSATEASKKLGISSVAASVYCGLADSYLTLSMLEVTGPKRADDPIPEKENPKTSEGSAREALRG